MYLCRYVFLNSSPSILAWGYYFTPPGSVPGDFAFFPADFVSACPKWCPGVPAGGRVARWPRGLWPGGWPGGLGLDLGLGLDFDLHVGLYLGLGLGLESADPLSGRACENGLT